MIYIIIIISETELKDCNKKIIKLNICKDKVDECDSIMEQYHKAQKDLITYQDKFQEYSSTIKEVKHLTSMNEDYVNKIEDLNKELTDSKAINGENYLKIKRLCRIEEEKVLLDTEIAAQKEEFAKLVNKKSELDYEVSTLGNKLKTQELDYTEKIEEYDNRKAMLENQLNNKQAEFLKLTEETEAQIKDLESQLRENRLKIEETTKQNVSLKSYHTEVVKNKEQTYAENLILKSDIENLKALLNNTESSSESEKLELKKSLKESNLKVS